MRTLALAIGSLALLAAAPWIGPELSGAEADFILWQLRIPRVLLGALAGAVLGLVGAVYQTIFDNPLATPSTVGTIAGASLGVLVSLVLLGGGAGFGGIPLVTLAAFAGAAAASFAVLAIAASGRASMADVLLVGIAITLAAGAVTTGLQVQADMAETFRAVRWSLGHLAQVGYDGVLGLLPFAVAAIAGLLWMTRALEALVGGEERAHTQGVDVVSVRTLAIGLGSLGVAAVVAWCGPIAFVGLIVPHLVRLALGARRRVLLPMSALGGAVFLVLSDVVARTALTGRDLPVGAVTAAIGAPALIALVLRRR